MKRLATPLIRRLVPLLTVLFLLLAACGQDPTPAPTVVSELETAVPTTPPPTATPTVAPSSTPPPSATPPPSPTEPPTETPTPAATGIPEIVVHVINAATGESILGATVALFVETLNLSVTETTGEDGIARFPNMSAGTYPLTISALTYEESSLEIQVGGGENLVEVELTRLPPPVVFASANAGRTNLRSGPGEEFTVLRRIQFQERVEVIGRTRDAEWLLVQTNDGLEGWVAADVMDTDQPVEIVYEATPGPTQTPTPLPLVNGTILTQANLRDRPGPDEAVITQLAVGTTVQVIAKTEDSNWLLVRTAENVEGWLFVDVVALETSIDLVPLYVPTPIPTATLDPSVTPPTPTWTPTPSRTPTPTITPFPTPVPGEIPTVAPFNPFSFRAGAIYMDSYVVELGGTLDRLFSEGYSLEMCDQFRFYYALIEASPRFGNVHPDWLGMYQLYDSAQVSVLDTNDDIVVACDNQGNITPINYSLARDAINNAHDALVAAIAQANERLGPPPP